MPPPFVLIPIDHTYTTWDHVTTLRVSDTAVESADACCGRFNFVWVECLWVTP
jgi:hypothetical protein